MPLIALDSAAREANLRERIRDVYAAFLGYGLEPNPRFSGMYDDSSLRTCALQCLPPMELESYQWKAMTTWGNVEYFKHFLP